MFFGIPEWALGVGVIIIAGSVAKALSFAISPGRAEERERLRGERLRGRKPSLRDLSQAIDDIRGKAGDTEEVQRRLDALEDRKSTRLNSSHSSISYAVFCLKKKNNVLI